MSLIKPLSGSFAQIVFIIALSCSATSLAKSNEKHLSKVPTKKLTQSAPLRVQKKPDEFRLTLSEKTPAYDLLKLKSKELQATQTSNGWAYIISGAVMVGVSIPGYYLSKDTFARVIYSIGETVGVAAVGYGSYLTLVDNDFTRFEKIIDIGTTLTEEQKEQLSKNYFKEGATRAKSARKIRVISHSLTAGLNFLNAATSSNADLKTALYFLGGVNSLATLSYLLSSSEEEKTQSKLVTASAGILNQGPGLLLAVRF